MDGAEGAYHFSVGIGRLDRSVCKWKASVLLDWETKLALLLEQGQFGQKQVSLSSAERGRVPFATEAYEELLARVRLPTL